MLFQPKYFLDPRYGGREGKGRGRGRVKPNLKGRAISWSYRLADDGHFCVDFSCRARPRISDPFPKPQRKETLCRDGGWPSSFALALLFPLNGFSCDLRDAAQILRAEITSFQQPRISLVNSSTTEAEGIRVHCVPNMISRQTYPCVRNAIERTYVFMSRFGMVRWRVARIELDIIKDYVTRENREPGRDRRGAQFN